MIKKEGYSFSFDESACAGCGGKCCTGEAGYIWVNPQEIIDIAKFLDIEVEEFKKKYLFKEGYKFSIKEIRKENNSECVFYDSKILGCSIYDVRPNQCRTFPFWDYFLKYPKQAGEECIGIIYH